MTTNLSVQNINKTYTSPKGTIKALDNISLDVSGGSFITLLGPSGCGKTTLLNIIAGFLKPDSGKIMSDGKIINQPGKDRVMIFQNNSVFPWMTVEENIVFALSNSSYNQDDIKEKVDRFLKLVRLQDFSYYHPKQLSGGMRKRVDVARAFAINPPFVLADEPFASLDSKTKLNLQLEIMKLWEVEKNTIIFVTHDIEEAIFLSDSIFLLSARPAHVIEKIDVAFQRPRVQESIVSSEFQQLRKQIISKLYED